MTSSKQCRCSCPQCGKKENTESCTCGCKTCTNVSYGYSSAVGGARINSWEKEFDERFKFLDNIVENFGYHKMVVWSYEVKQFIRELITQKSQTAQIEILEKVEAVMEKEKTRLLEEKKRDKDNRWPKRGSIAVRLLAYLEYSRKIAKLKRELEK